MIKTPDILLAEELRRRGGSAIAMAITEPLAWGGPRGIVLAGMGGQFVTWRFATDMGAGKVNFSLGHYFTYASEAQDVVTTERAKALRDFLERDGSEVHEYA